MCIYMQHVRDTLLYTDALINAVSGNVDEGLIFCGAYAYKINDISTVKDIIKNYF